LISRPEVALVNMPFCEGDQPSLGLSLLKASLVRSGVPSDIHYLNIRFTARIGSGAFQNVDHLSRPYLAGEWVFAEALWGKDAQRDAAFLDELAAAWGAEQRLLQKESDASSLLRELSRCRAEAAGFIDDCLKDIPWDEYRVVGFSSQFHQQAASLALARRLKERYPDLAVVFGGANCRAEMGEALFCSFPFLDAVCTGEGDVVFPEYVGRRLDGRTPQTVPGLLCRGTESAGAGRAPACRDLDELPFPDFDDFFDQRRRFPDPGIDKLFVLFETSRGCWWGERSHCAFCGLNADALGFRQKSAPRAFAEILRQRERYGSATRYFAAADNNLPPDMIRSLLPMLKEAGLGIEIFYDTRSGLKKEHLRLFRDAGLREIQAGIESLDTASLRRMKKGLTALHNIQMLKWCRQFGIMARWYYLFGFPGEEDGALRRPLRIIPLISHLQPPYEARPIRLDRFSPHFMRPDDFGLRDLRPSPFYHRVYPGLDEQALGNLAYYFVAEYDAQDDLEARSGDLLRAVRGWAEQAGQSALFSIDEEDRLLLGDFRPSARKPLFVLTGPERRVYEACDQIRSGAYLRRLLSAEMAREANDGDVASLAKPLLDHGLMIEENNRYLSLAVPLGFEYFPPEPVWARMAEVPDLFSVLEP
jgi:ribosomal peptide maturation radical SAM protein 1